MCLLHVSGQLYGLEKFWAFLKYSRIKVNIDKRLKQMLSKYKRLEDFRVEVCNICSLFYGRVVDSTCLVGHLMTNSILNTHFCLITSVINRKWLGESVDNLLCDKNSPGQCG